MTYTYALLEVSQETYNEIATKMRQADYSQAFHDDGVIDMHGIALVAKEQEGADKEEETIKP